MFLPRIYDQDVCVALVRFFEVLSHPTVGLGQNLSPFFVCLSRYIKCILVVGLLAPASKIASSGLC